MRATLASLVVALGLSPCVFAAGTVHLAIHDGRVDLTANGASIPQILDEWSRVGGTRVVNAERLPAMPVTIELNGVPEAQAIDTLLRAAAGFIAVPRRSAQAGASQFARILILPTSVAPPASAVPATATFAAPPPPFTTPPPVRALPRGATPVVGPDGRPVADDQEGAPGPPANYGPSYPPNTIDQARPGGSMPPGFSPPAAPGFAPPSAPAAGGVTTPPAMQQPSAAPAAPVGSSTPGTIVKPEPQRRPGGR